jgi:hypothetical protein
MHEKNSGVPRGLCAALGACACLAFLTALAPRTWAVGVEVPAEYADSPSAFGGDPGPELEPPIADPFAGGAGPASSSSPAVRLPRNATFRDQSAYAMGKMSWNVIFLESNGAIDVNQENWTTAELNKIKNEINQSKTYWEGLTAGFVPGARLSIDIHYENGGVPMATPYEPITRSSTQESLWVNGAMNALGYTSSNQFTNVLRYNQDRRIADGNHWATTIFVVDDTVDSDNRFSNMAFAYAYFNGPFIMVTQGNDGWTDNNFNLVLSHEMGHIFGALDEYQQSNVRNSQRGGYLNGETLNASLDSSGSPVTPPQPNALMLNNGSFSTSVSYLPHPSASVNFGHRDTDSDGIPDILDTPAFLTGNADASDSGAGNFVFNGDIFVDDYPNANPLNFGISNTQARMTINTIVAMEYSLDGGAPVLFDAVDGDYDDYAETLGFSLFGLPQGMHTIEIAGIDSVGNFANVLNFNFMSTFIAVPEPSALALTLVAVVGAIITQRRR